MPKNKSASIRYDVLNQCFKDSFHQYFIDDLCSVCSDKLHLEMLSKSTIMKDMKYMKDALQAPIKPYKKGKKTYYRYADLDFSINHELLTNSEKNQLESSVSTLMQFKGLPQFNWVEDIAQNLQKVLKYKFPTQQIVFFESIPELRGLDFFDDLFHAISHKLPQIIHYCSFASPEPIAWTIHPYILKEYNNRWYVFAHCEEADALYCLALDRIEALELSQHSYIETSLDFEAYFDDVIGVTVYQDRPLETIELKFSPARFKYIKTKPLHGSQINLSLKPNTVQLKLIPNKEFVAQLLYFGHDVEVIFPPKLRELVKDTALKMCQNYAS